MEQGRILTDNEVKDQLINQQPYSDWLDNYKIKLEELEEPRVTYTYLSKESVFKYQKTIWFLS